MTTIKYGAVLLAAFVIGCASAPEDLASGGTAPATAAAPVAAGAPAEAAPAVTPTLTVNANQLAQLPTITCRELLKQGSNVIVTQCMTAEGWKAYERWEAQEAQAIVRMLQGSRYR